MNSFLPSIHRVLVLVCPECFIRGQTIKLSLCPTDITSVDALLLQAPWQQRTNDALLLHPLIHIVWVVIVQPWKV